MKNSFYIAGGDLRSVYLAKSLSEEGYKTAVFALEKANLPEDFEIIEKTENFINAEIVKHWAQVPRASSSRNATYSIKLPVW